MLAEYAVLVIKGRNREHFDRITLRDFLQHGKIPVPAQDIAQATCFPCVKNKVFQFYRIHIPRADQDRIIIYETCAEEKACPVVNILTSINTSTLSMFYYYNISFGNQCSALHNLTSTCFIPFHIQFLNTPTWIIKKSFGMP